jgi:hypothetical protein
VVRETEESEALKTEQEANEAQGEEEEEVEVSWFIDRGSGPETSTKTTTAPQAIIDLITPPRSPSDSQELYPEDDDELIRPFPPDMPVFVFTDSSFGEESDDDEDDSDESSGDMSDLDEQDLISTNDNGDLDIHINCSPSSAAALTPTPLRLPLTSPKSLPRETRQHEQQILYALSHYLRSLDYIRALEFRSHARVPIINLIHKGDIECDISLGLSQQKTNNLIQLLSYQHSVSSPLRSLPPSSSTSSSRSLALSTFETSEEQRWPCRSLQSYLP